MNRSEFLKACAGYKELNFEQFFGDPFSLEDEKIKYLSSELKEYHNKRGVSAVTTKEYLKSDIFGFYHYLWEKNKKKYGGSVKDIKERLTGDALIKTLSKLKITNQNQQRFLTLTLSEKFQKELSAIRKRYGVPNDGFKNNPNYQEWRLKTKKESVYSLDKNLDSLFSEYGLVNIPGISYWYFMFGLGSPIKYWLEQKKSDNPIFTLQSDSLLRLHDTNRKNNFNYPFSHSLDRLFLIIIKEPISEKQLSNFIKDNNIKKKTNNFFKKISLHDNFIRDFIMYHLHKSESLSYSKIKGAMNNLGYEDIDRETIKKAVKKFNYEIESLEKMGN